MLLLVPRHNFFFFEPNFNNLFFYLFSYFKSDESPKPEYVKYYKKFFHDAQHLYDLVDQQPEDRQEEIYKIINEKSYELWTVLVRCIQSSTPTHDYDTKYNRLVALISNRS